MPLCLGGNRLGILSLPVCSRMKSSNGFKRKEAQSTQVRTLGLSDPNGNRTRVTGVKGRCPRPLDDGASAYNYLTNRRNSTLEIIARRSCLSARGRILREIVEAS